MEEQLLNQSMSLIRKLNISIKLTSYKARQITYLLLKLIIILKEQTITQLFLVISLNKIITLLTFITKISNHFILVEVNFRTITHIILTWMAHQVKTLELEMFICFNLSNPHLFPILHI
jgi:hypothetical protein